MTKKVINKSDISKLLKDANNEYNVYVPMEHIGGDVLFSLLSKENNTLEDDIKRINLSSEKTVNSPKEIFYPQLDTMMEYNDKGEIKETVENSKKLVFGVRPCDFHAIAHQDHFFSKDYEDKYYLSRRDDSLIVVIGCNQPPLPNECFCTSVGTGPFLTEKFDIQLVDLGDYYLVEIGNEKGADFVNKHEKYFSAPFRDEIKHAESTKLEAEENVTLKVNFNKALQIMKTEEIPQDNLERIAERCIECGACVYVCPTCTCFDVFDDMKDGQGVRCRIWDTCVFSGYTKEASGHNPGAKKEYRAARRYEHKLKYDTLESGISGCIGCGRCLHSCPVDIGMSNFIKEITTNQKYH